MENKKVLLAVCGSISFYKAFEILSMLKKENFDVYVALSDGALEFVNYKSFEALCDHPVLCSKTEDWKNGVSHTEYSKMDLVIVAPASVNTINKLANGICDNVFMQTLIATKAPIILAPAANNRMLENFSTKNSIEKLKNNGVAILEPIVKILACKDEGRGGLTEPYKIVYAAKRAILKDDFFSDKTVLITGGPTTEKIDDVRGITNFASGKMAKALADAFYFLGAEVVLISSIKFEAPYKIVKFETSVGLQSAMTSIKLKKNDIFIMNAAVNDYLPKNKIRGKVSKDEMGNVWNIKLTQNLDILTKFSNENPNVKKIGFKLESDPEVALENAKKMLNAKNLDAVCLNILDDNVKIGGDNTEISFIDKKKTINLELAPKFDVAMKIAKLVKNL